MELNNKDKEEFKKLMLDEIMFGESYCKVDSDGIKRLNPMDSKTISLMDKLRPYQEATNLHSFMTTEKLTIEQLIERYPLTEEQVINLRKLINENK